MNPAFMAANTAGNYLGEAFKNARETSALDSILSNAMSSNDPEVMRYSIGKILSSVAPEKQAAALNLITNKAKSIEQNLKQQNINRAYQEQGISPSEQYLPPGVQAQNAKNRAAQQQFSQITGGIIPSGETIQPIEKMPQGEMQNVNVYKNLDDDQLIALTGNPLYGKGATEELRNRQQQRKEPTPQKEFEKGRVKQVGEIVNKAFATRQEAEDTKYSIETAKKAIEGNVAGPGLLAVVKNKPYGQLFVGLTPDEAELQAANKTLVAGAKGIFGSRPTEKEIFLLLNSMLPSIGKSKEANRASLAYIERINDMKITYADLVDELTDGGQKYIPNLEKQIATRMQPISEALLKDLKNDEKKLSKFDKQAIKIEVTSPNGQKGFMTQTQIDEAKKDGIIFKPVNR